MEKAIAGTPAGEVDDADVEDALVGERHAQVQRLVAPDAVDRAEDEGIAADTHADFHDVRRPPVDGVGIA